jgi:hypothetical protein
MGPAAARWDPNSRPRNIFHHPPNLDPNRGIYFSWLWNLGHGRQPAALHARGPGGGWVLGLGALRPRLLGRLGSAAATARHPWTSAETKTRENPNQMKRLRRNLDYATVTAVCVVAGVI